MKGSNEIQRQKIVKALLKVIGVGLLAAIFSNAFLQWTQNELQINLVWLFAVNWHTEIFIFSTLILFVLFIWFTSLIGNKWVGAGLLIGLSGIFGFITYNKMLIRQEPFYPNDLTMISELPFLITMLSVGQWIGLAVIFIIVAMGIYWLRKRSKKKKRIRTSRQYLARGLGFIGATLILAYVGHFNRPGNLIKAAYDPYAYWIPYSQQMNYYNNGFVGGFLYNLCTEAMVRPVVYSAKKMAEIDERYQQKAQNLNEKRTGSLANTNVIYVMNESFSDPLALEGLKTNKDPIAFARRFMQQTIHGKVLTQGIGGGTANSEFEALTSVSMEPLNVNMTSPYTQMDSVMNQLPSLAKQLSQLGHVSTAIHPYNTSMYKRKEVYPALGFNHFLHEENMMYQEKYGVHSYISDEAAYKEVLSVMEETDEKDFIHLVTMQNHMPYGSKYDRTRFTVNGSGNQKEAEGYFEDLFYSDQALEELINQLSAHNEKILLVFWGDHLPGFYGEEIKETNGTLAMFEAPFFIWSNQSNAMKDVGTISPIFFHNHILEANEVAVTPFMRLLMDLEEELPAFEKGMYLEAGEEKLIQKRENLSPEARRLLEEYTLVLYDLLEGEGYLDKKNFFGN